jgi:hypothetical protein
MKFTRRQVVEGGLAAGFLGLAAKPAFAGTADDPAGTLGVRRRPDGSLAGTSAGSAPRYGQPLRQPHPGQPLPAGSRMAQPQVVGVRPAPVSAPASQMAQRPVYAQPRVQIERSVNPQLVAAARASFDKHRSQIRHPGVVGIVDFSKASREPRYYLLDTNSGRVSEHHVSHGRGSDPAHSGWAQHFSNRHGSNASSEGGYVTGDTYYGKYGLSQRVRGLDWSNSNAHARAIVIHPAWYAEQSHLATHGLLGRSEGCFAMSRTSLNETLNRLSPGHFLYAART